MAKAAPPENLLAGLSEASRLLENRSAVQDAIGRALARPTAPRPARATPAQRAQVRAWRDEGARLRRQRQPAEAAAVLRRVVRLDPEDAATWHALGSACLEAGQPAEAAAALMEAVQRQPTLADAHFHIGMAFEMLGDVQPALAAFTRAAELAPRSIDVAGRLANVLAMLDRREEAAAHLLRAAAGAPGSIAAALARARAFGLTYRPEAAEPELRRVLAQQPDHALAWRLLGNVLAALGDVAGSAAASRRAAELNPLQATAFLDLTRAVTITEADRPLLSRMASVQTDPRLTARQRMQLHFALGKAHDDLDERAEAMAQFDAANRIRARLTPFDRAAAVAAADRIIATFTPAFFRAHAGLGSTDARPILVLGMPRSGTTLTEQILSRHPAVAGAGEVHFWTRDANCWPTALAPGAAPTLIARLVADYQAELRAVSADAPRVTDKNPYNFSALGVIRLAFPNACVVHCRRHPIDTCLSLYTTFIGSQTNFAANRADLVLFYRQYLRVMAHWRAVLPAERFYEIDYETLIADREAETRRLLAFCGLEWDPACLTPEQNRRAVHTASLYQARRPVYASSVARWRRYQPWLGELLALADDAAGG